MLCPTDFRLCPKDIELFSVSCLCCLTLTVVFKVTFAATEVNLRHSVLFQILRLAQCEVERVDWINKQGHSYHVFLFDSNLSWPSPTDRQDNAVCSAELSCVSTEPAMWPVWTFVNLSVFYHHPSTQTHPPHTRSGGSCQAVSQWHDRCHPLRHEMFVRTLRVNEAVKKRHQSWTLD